MSKGTLIMSMSYKGEQFNIYAENFKTFEDKLASHI